MEILFIFHSHFRWLVVLVSLFILVKFLYGWLAKTGYKKMDEVLVKIYAGLIDLQITLGLIFLIWSGLAYAGFPRFRLEHTSLMLIVMVLAHLFGRWKTSPDNIRFRNGFIIMLLSGILIFVAIILLPAGLNRWMIGR